MDLTSELSKSLSKYLNWNKARLNCFVRMILALLKVRTVNLIAGLLFKCFGLMGQKIYLTLEGVFSLVSRQTSF